MSLDKDTWHSTELGLGMVEAFSDNYLKTITNIYWNNRTFMLYRYMTELGVEEYAGEVLESDIINTWNVEFPPEKMTGEEVWKWFWFLVVMNDPQRLAAHAEKVKEFRQSKESSREPHTW